MLISVNMTHELAVLAALDCALTAQAFDQPAALLFLGLNTVESTETLTKPAIISKLRQLSLSGYPLYCAKPEGIDREVITHMFPAITVLPRQNIGEVMQAHTHCISF